MTFFMAFYVTVLTFMTVKAFFTSSETTKKNGEKLNGLIIEAKNNGSYEEYFKLMRISAIVIASFYAIFFFIAAIQFDNFIFTIVSVLFIIVSLYDYNKFMSRVKTVNFNYKTNYYGKIVSIAFLIYFTIFCETLSGHPVARNIGFISAFIICTVVHLNSMQKKKNSV